MRSTEGGRKVVEEEGGCEGGRSRGAGRGGWGETGRGTERLRPRAMMASAPPCVVSTRAAKERERSGRGCSSRRCRAAACA